ncbi:hypothetical protein [Luteimonas panaciterrae]|uniref:hypothetical protein n=1 Tax=Luteimonas panaciterrae TaxID=363885 RepID=UPI001CF96918|nr:hypothetical protein [Luteimonas panaciterrae]
MATPIGFSLQAFYSIQHIQAAAYFSKQATKLESKVRNDNDPKAVALKAYVTSTLFLSVAFLEALTNEMLADAAEESGGHLQDIPLPARELIAELGRTETVQLANILAKFDLILRAAGKPPVKGESAHENIQLLVRLRNAMMHYKASFFDWGTEGMTRAGDFNRTDLPKKIAGRFPLRQGDGVSPPEGWISAGCAQWAVRSVFAYADLVFSRLGISPYYDHVCDNRHSPLDRALDQSTVRKEL